MWRESKISYQEALDNFEIFANCINFHTKRQLTQLQQYLTAPDDSSSTTSPPPTPSSTSSPKLNFLAGAGQGLVRSDSAPIVRSQWLDKENGKKEANANGERNGSPEKEKGGSGEKDNANEGAPIARPHRSKSFGAREKTDYGTQLLFTFVLFLLLPLFFFSPSHFLFLYLFN